MTDLPRFRLSGLFVLGLQLLSPGCGEHHSPPSTYHPSEPSEDGAAQATSAPGWLPARSGAGYDAGSSPSLLPFSWNNWTECYVGYAIGPNPSLDAFRLGLLCGPSNGLSLVSEGVTSAAAVTTALERMSWETRRDDCWRWVVVAGPQTDQVQVTLEEPNGTEVAYLTPRARYRVVPPRGPWCTPRGGRVGVRVTTWPAGGEVAYQAWRLR